MHKYSLYDRILGSLTVVGIGDAIGAPTEAMSRQEIEKKYVGRITTFMDGHDNPYALGNKIGEVTDDASQMYEMALAIAATGGKLTVEAAAEAIINWSRNFPKYYPRNAGPTTRSVIVEILAGKDPIEVGMIGGTYDRGTSNGAAMRVAAAGLAHPGDWAKAADTAITSCRPSHGTQHAFAGACAIACGISEAVTENAQISSILRACLYGAQQGHAAGIKTARKACGPTVYNRIMKAIEIGYAYVDMETAERRLEEEIGNDGSIQNSTAVAIGLFLAADGDPVKTVLGRANIGGDSDTIACIAGTLAGAYKGYEAIPLEWRQIFEQVNVQLKFKDVAERLTDIAKGKQE